MRHGEVLVTDDGRVAIGTVLAGRYRVERVLGQGGMGIVVQAMHLQLYQPVAMKFLLHEVLGNQQVVQRFLRGTPQWRSARGTAGICRRRGNGTVRQRVGISNERTRGRTRRDH